MIHCVRLAHTFLDGRPLPGARSVCWLWGTTAWLRVWAPRLGLLASIVDGVPGLRLTYTVYVPRVLDCHVAFDNWGPDVLCCMGVVWTEDLGSHKLVACGPDRRWTEDHRSGPHLQIGGQEPRTLRGG